MYSSGACAAKRAFEKTHILDRETELLSSPRPAGRLRPEKPRDPASGVPAKCISKLQSATFTSHLPSLAGWPDLCHGCTIMAEYARKVMQVQEQEQQTELKLK